MSEISGIRLKILCVDDEAEILNIQKKELEPLGFEVLNTTSSLEAFELIKQHHAHLVLVVSDYQMPEWSGFDLRKAMLADYKHIPFILISAHISRENALKAIELKLSAFLEKPFRKEVFLQHVETETKERIATIKDDIEMLNGFVIEAESLLEEMETLILSLESEPQNVESINRIFACAHTIKGTSGFFKPDHVHKFTHKYEDFLSNFKKNPELIRPEYISVLLQALDTIKTLIFDLKNHHNTTRNIEQLCSIFKVDISSPPSVAQSNITTVPPPGQTPGNHSKGSEEIRVNVELLNQFMEMSGELTVLRNMTNKMIKVVESTYPTDQNISTLDELLNEMHKVNSSMQTQVVELRKVSLKQVFKPLIRTLRDLNISLKKNIQFEISGDELRVDHRIAETLNKCLIHMLRNSADHGIESKGKIQLQAEETGDVIIIRLKDDGRGIDPQKVKKKSIEKGLITQQQADLMTDNELQMLIFEPGFSTAEKVTDVSGRGVGTDMVKKTIQSINGYIELNSAVGKGTEFVLHLPIPKSVLIISSLLIKCGGLTLGIPQDEIQKVSLITEDFSKNHIKKIGKNSFFEDETVLLPVVDLNDTLGLPPSTLKTPRNLITIIGKTHQLCLAADEVLETEDIVVKQLGPWFAAMKMYSGATFLGDGRIGLVINPEMLITELQAPSTASKKHNLNSVALDKAEKQPFTTPASILLVKLTDDKQSYGILQKEIFRLEVFEQSSIQYSGNQAVAIYRGQTIPLIEMRCLIDPERTPRKIYTDKVPVIIQCLDSHFVGLIVDSIGDLILDTNQEVKKHLEPYIVGDHTVTMILMNELPIHQKICVTKSASAENLQHPLVLGF